MNQMLCCVAGMGLFPDFGVYPFTVFWIQFMVRDTALYISKVCHNPFVIVTVLHSLWGEGEGSYVVLSGLF